MNKNTLIGLLIIGGMLLGFSWWNAKQAEKYNEQKKVADSIALAERRELGEPIEILQPNDPVAQAAAGISADSAKVLQFGETLYEASQAGEKFYTLENNVLKLTVSSLGGKVVSAQLKDYQRYDGTPIEFYAEGSAEFDLGLFIRHGYNDAELHTSEYNFQGDVRTVMGETYAAEELSMRLYVDSTSYIEYLYTLKPGEYMVDFKIAFVGMQENLSNQSNMDLSWSRVGPQMEKGFDNENNYTNISYKYPGERGLEQLKMSKGLREKREPNRVEWVAFKQQFFSSIFFADDSFGNADMSFDTYTANTGNIKKFDASLAVPFDRNKTEYGFQFYYGPNKYSLLRQYDNGTHKLIPLGGNVIGLVNKGIVIPVFDWLGKYISSFGLVILLLTIFIKLLIFPLTYRSYLSSAKMRVLKPEIDEINEKYPKQEDAMKKQQATMDLYKRAGVNPMGGCLPMLIQFPILIAMFRFFPSSIELRGKSFLWAEDLSSYDSILDLPFEIPFYGDHVSLFTLLMAVALHISSRISYAQTAASTPQMGGMKFMMLWMMPVMLMLWFNNYASGLSYYYLLSNIITIGQTLGIRRFVDDEKIHAQLKANSKKPQKVKKKSKWQQRYDEMMKAQQAEAARQAKKRK